MQLDPRLRNELIYDGIIKSLAKDIHERAFPQSIQGAGIPSSSSKGDSLSELSPKERERFDHYFAQVLKAVY